MLFTKLLNMVLCLGKFQGLIGLEELVLLFVVFSFKLFEVSWGFFLLIGYCCLKFNFKSFLDLS